MITIKPFGGLGNRMRALDSSYWLAKELDEPIHLIWEKNTELNCSFQKLFEIPRGMTYEEHSASKNKVALIKRLNKGLRAVGFKIPKGFDHYLFEKDIIELRKRSFDFKEIEKYNNVYINTSEPFHQTNNAFSFFKPVITLQKVIDAYTQQFSQNTIGIHIRRTDNENAIKYSPLTDFLDIMKKEIVKNPEINFFLATDSAEVNDRIKDSMGDRIITHPKVLDRNSDQGIEDALVDIYCLSECNKIIGSYFSSFSEVAAQINNINLHQIYKG